MKHRGSNGLAKILKEKFYLTVTVPHRRLMNNPEEMLTTLSILQQEETLKTQLPQCRDLGDGQVAEAEVEKDSVPEAHAVWTGGSTMCTQRTKRRKLRGSRLRSFQEKRNCEPSLERKEGYGLAKPLHPAILPINKRSLSKAVPKARRCARVCAQLQPDARPPCRQSARQASLHHNMALTSGQRNAPVQ